MAARVQAAQRWARSRCKRSCGQLTFVAEEAGATPGLPPITLGGGEGYWS
jgi:hypothetical protein